MKISFIALLACIFAPSAYAQDSRIYLKEAHIIVSLAASAQSSEGLQVRGVTHKNQKINVVFYGLETLQGGKQLKSDCTKYFGMANSVPNMRMELYVSGMAPVVSAANDPRGYRAISFQLTGQTVVAGCVLSDSTKFNDQTSPSVIWYEFP